jgi:hypothetical protein
MNPRQMEELQLPEGFRKSLRRLRRGGIIFQSLSLLFLVSVGLAAWFDAVAGWWIAAGLMALICRLTVVLSIGPRYISTYKAATDPSLVYWVHGLGPGREPADASAPEPTTIRLHLKDGSQVDIETARGTGTTPEQLQEIVTWLRQRNAAIRFGKYDQPSA